MIDYVKVWNKFQLTALVGTLLSIIGLIFLRSRYIVMCFLVAIGVMVQATVIWIQWVTWSKDYNPYAAHPMVSLLKQEVRDGRLAQSVYGLATTMFMPNTLYPNGVAIAGGYDSIHPLGMKKSGNEVWSFPGVTHFLHPVAVSTPAGWSSVWRLNGWELSRNPNPVIGFAEVGSISRNMLSITVNKLSLNVREVVVPIGVKYIEIQENWHRGWKWKYKEGTKWNYTRCADNNAIGIPLETPTSSARIIILRFFPSPLPWILAITSICGFVIIVWFTRDIILYIKNRYSH
jgi:hypothetical protein